jgi:hypothetical protein
MNEPYKPKYSSFDFSARAIEYRFECGSWTSDDVRFIVEVLSKLEAYGQVTASMAEDLANRRRELMARRKPQEADRADIS